MPRVMLSQIAEAAGVSQATVSFVLNGREPANGSIRPETATRVQNVARELGYRPNRSARALATGRSDLIGLCMWDLAAAHYAEVTRQVANCLESSAYHLLVSCLRTQRAEDDPRLLPEIFPWPLDGVLALEAASALTIHWKSCGRWPAPIVSMGGTYFEVQNLDYVGIDLAAGVRQAISHLMDRGCRRIAFASQKDVPQRDELRSVAYAGVMQKHRRPLEYIPLEDNARTESREGIKAYIEEHGCPDGIFCFNDEVALGCYRGLCDLGIKMPEEVALIGCDGIEDTQYLECPISTIMQPVGEMCGIAWEMLQARIKNPQSEFQRKVLLPQLAIRDSSTCFKGGTA